MTIHDRIMSRYYARRRETGIDPKQVFLGRQEAQELVEEFRKMPSVPTDDYRTTYNGMTVTVTNKETFIDFV